MSVQPGAVLAGYEVLEVIGAGGMGKVYKVRNTLSNRIEAMKVVLPDLENDPQLTTRFLREIQVLAGLSHPNIVALHTALQSENRVVMILELVEGTPLSQRIQQGPVPVHQCVSYAYQILDALNYAHRQGVVHRDIKPENIILARDGIVKLVDFGIARTAFSPSLTVTGAAIGSLYYISPEQVQGATPDARSDIYSLGITLYELLTGARPIAGDTAYSLMNAHLHAVPDPPHRIARGVPPALSEIIMKALAKSPAKRYQTAAEFQADLQRVPAYVTPRQAARRKAYYSIMIGTFCAVSGLIVAAYVASQSQSPQRHAHSDVAAVKTVPKPSPVVPVAPPPEERSAAESDRAATSEPTPAKTVPALKAPATLETGMELWPEGTWVQQDGWWVHKGGDFVLYPAMPVRGSVTFTALRRKGRKVQWVLDYRDSGHYVLFQIDEKGFTRKKIDNGKSTLEATIAHAIAQDMFTIQIEVTPDSVVHSLYAEGGWRALDRWSDPSLDFTTGSFGFFIPGRDEIGLSNFKFLQRK
ncbi:MAG TPA: serine/threonine-protein kinase [Bryobacteraceae bacterium]|nr:serine/threonine-protein kinase [Bryobacteraceae bacterium]